MSDQTNVFNEDNSEVTPQQQSSDNPFADQLASIKNDNGEQKYKDVETALKALDESQRYIQQLKAEKAEAERLKAEREAELAKMGSIEDFVNRISPNSQKQVEPKDHEAPKGLSEEDVDKLFQARLAAVKKAEQEQNNLNQVVRTLTEKHGENTSAHIKEVAQKNNTTPAALEELAKSNPVLALSLLGGDGVFKKTTPSSTLPHSSTQIKTEEANIRPQVDKGKGAARGGLTDTELRDLWRQSAEYTNKRLGIQT